MDQQKVPMTLQGKKQLEEELEQLIKVERENVKTAIATAREHGDLRENAEYHSAKEKQSHIEGRISELQHQMANARVIDISQLTGPKIIFGATVTLKDVEKDKVLTYQIVGTEEANLKEGKISYTSPLAQALIGKEEGDVVLVNAPKGKIQYEIERVGYTSDGEK